MIMLRMIKHTNSKAILLVPEYVRKDYVLKNMVEKNIFNHIILFDDRRFYKIPSEKKMLNDVVDYFDSLLQENRLDLLNVSDIYISCDMTNSFGMYLLERGKQFTICEISPNTTLLRSRYDGAFNDGWMGEPYYKYQKKNGLLCGEKGNCNIIIYPESDITRIKKDTGMYSVFNFGDYSALTKDQIGKIISCFNVDTSCLEDDIQLVTLSSRNMCNGHSVYNTEQSVYLFQLLLQYFGKSRYKRIIKPHPHDTVKCFDGYFPEVTFLNPEFPIEFIKISNGLKIRELLSITSSSTDKIANIVENRTEVGWIFYKLAPYLTRLDICYQLIEKNTNTTLVNQKVTPEWNDLENKFMKLFFIKNGYKDMATTNAISNDICCIRNKLDPSVVDLVNNTPLILFFEYETFKELDFDHVTPIRIEFYPSENSYFGEYTQWIYCYTPDLKIKKKLESTHARFLLKETSQEVVVNSLPNSSLFTIQLKHLKIIADNLNGRKIITWGIDERMENDLYRALGLKVEGKVYWNKNLITEESDHHFPWISNKKSEIYLICWNIKMDDKLSSYFNENKFIENEDFILISSFPPP